MSDAVDAVARARGTLVLAARSDDPVAIDMALAGYLSAWSVWFYALAESRRPA